MKYGLRSNPFQELTFLSPETDANGGGNTGETITFKNQADLDALIQKRLDRQKNSLRDELKEELRGEIKTEIEAETNSDFKKLYEAEQAKVEKLENKVTELEGEKKDREFADLRASVAKKHNIPEELVDRLKGETEDELTADAKTLVKTLKLDKKEDEDSETKTKTPKVPSIDVGLRPPVRQAKPSDDQQQQQSKQGFVFVKAGDVSWGSSG